MLDKVGNSSGKIYLNGTVVIHANSQGNLTDRFGDSRNRKKRVYKLNFKSKQKLYDAITYQNFMASHDADLYHCFLTLTFKRSNIPSNPNEAIGEFFQNWKKSGLRNYTWVREIGSKGLLPHYHITSVATHRPIKAINRSWCSVRGYFTSNAVRTAPNRGMVIHSLDSARRYVAKYMTKAEETQEVKLPGRIYGVSNNLVFDPLTIDSTFAGGLIHDPWYSEGRIYRGDFSTVGHIQGGWKSISLYEDLKTEIMNQKDRERQRELDRMIREQKEKKVKALKRAQLTLVS